VEPEDTDPADVVVPEAMASVSTAAEPAAVDSPLYSCAVMAASPDPENFALTVGVLPAPAVIGAVHTLCSVRSGPVKWLTSVNVSPAVSETLLVFAPEPLQTPTSTTRRFPVPKGVDGVTEILLPAAAWVLACWTKAGAGLADGVTALDADDAGPDPTALDAVTVNV
jgi:hypothetical protein